MGIVRSVFCLVLGLGASACVASAVPVASPEVIAKGGAVYEANCRSCHGGPGEKPQTAVPVLDGRGHAYLHSDADLQYIVEHGSDDLVVKIRAAQKLPADLPLMPAFAGTLSTDEIQAVIAYFKSLWNDDQRRYQQTVPSLIRKTQP